MMNNVNLIGRIAQDMELRKAGDVSVVNIRLAVDKGLSKDKREEFKKANKPTADFINLVAFGGTAETAVKYLTKGKLIGVTGRLQTGSYDAEDGTKRYTTDVIVNQLDILEWANEES